VQRRRTVDIAPASVSHTAKRTLDELERQRQYHEKRIEKAKEEIRVIDVQIKSLRSLVPAESKPQEGGK